MAARACSSPTRVSASCERHEHEPPVAAVGERPAVGSNRAHEHSEVQPAGDADGAGFPVGVEEARDETMRHARHQERDDGVAFEVAMGDVAYDMRNHPPIRAGLE
jgi:hypothetical protein